MLSNEVVPISSSNEPALTENTQSLSQNTSECVQQYLHPREVLFINKARESLKLCNPEMLYKFRHAPITLTAHLVHCFVFILSLCFILMPVFFWDSKQKIVGLGYVSDVTPLTYICDFIVFAIIAFSLRKLSLNLKVHFLPRYWVAMAANSGCKMIVLSVKSMILILAILGIVWTSNSLTPDLNGTSSRNLGKSEDIATTVFAIWYITITWVSFRHCHKELS